MRLLLLGGTAWLGRELAVTAVQRGHDVTCLARGESGEVPAGARRVQADRDVPDAHAAVAGEDWDAVIDVSRQPGHVRRAVSALAESSRCFVFVSSGNVYADHSTPGTDESAALLPPLEGDVMHDMETYGEAKVACEQAVLQGFGPERSLIARCGLIGGPGDASGRTGYWPWRFAHPATEDGSVLVPDAPGMTTQVIDVRDLARWLVDSAQHGRSGVFNAVGETVPLDDHLALAREVAGHRGPVLRAEQTWLQQHGVEPWMGERSLPLWLPLPEYAGFTARDGGAVRRAGLVSRPLRETLADALAWEHTRTSPRRAGLSDDVERQLVAALRPVGRDNAGGPVHAPIGEATGTDRRSHQ